MRYECAVDRRGRMDARQQNKGKVCSVAGCGRQAVAKGLCKPHYDMQRDHGRTDYQPVLMKSTKCKAEGCHELARQKGLCDKHYQRLRKYGDPNHVPPKTNGGKCGVLGCPDIASSGGFCWSHYYALKRYGDPLGTRPAKPKAEKNPEHRPPRGRPSFHGPCSEPGCGKVATKTGRCRRHSKVVSLTPSGSRAMLTAANIDYIRSNRNVSALHLADELNTTPRTVVAVQGGRNWGYLRD